MTTVGIRGTFFDFVDDPWKHIGNEQAAALSPGRPHGRHRRRHQGVRSL
ncbi:hypothetical protein AAE026_12025 [Bradyrhizobium sp. DN5]